MKVGEMSSLELDGSVSSNPFKYVCFSSFQSNYVYTLFMTSCCSIQDTPMGPSVGEDS